MATCTTTMAFYGCTNASGTSCTKSALVTALVPNATAPGSCAGSVVISAGEFTDYQALAVAMGWDGPAFEVAFGGGLLMFGIGLGIGLIVQAIRRARTV